MIKLSINPWRVTAMRQSRQFPSPLPPLGGYHTLVTERISTRISTEGTRVCSWLKIQEPEGELANGKPTGNGQV